MLVIGLKSPGRWKKTEDYMTKLHGRKQFDRLHSFGRQGVRALASATPVDSGETSISWDYEIVRTTRGVSLVWTNSNIVSGVPIAVIIQYGHGTGTGGYVQGRDYINPAIRPVFDKIADEVWKEVTSG
jgi:hypothetical protein